MLENEKNRHKLSQYISSAWNGNIKLWRAIVIVNFLGLLATFALSIAGAMALFGITGGKTLPDVYVFLIVTAYGVFAVTCLWRSAPPPQTSVKGALTRIWSIVFAFYLISIQYHLLMG